MTLEPLLKSTVRHKPDSRRVRRVAGAAALVVGLALSACGSISERLAERAGEAPGIGLPANAPERPATPVAYPAVHDMPPSRPAALLSEAEQARLEKELLAARARNQASAGVPITPEPAAKKPPAPEQARPVPSGRPIY